MEQKETGKHHHGAVAAAILGSSIIVGTFIIAGMLFASKQNVPSSKVINASGQAERMVTADTIKWTASIAQTISSSSIKKAADKMKADTQTVEQYLESQGINRDMIDFQPITMLPLCNDVAYVVYSPSGQAQGCSDGKTSKYTLTQNMTITSNDMNTVTQLAQETPGTLIDQGILFTGQNFEYTYSKIDDVKSALTMEATRSAATSAKSIADAMGTSITGIDSVTADPFQIVPANSSATYEGLGPMPQDTTSLEKKVMITIHATFRIQ